MRNESLFQGKISILEVDEFTQGPCVKPAILGPPTDQWMSPKLGW